MTDHPATVHIVDDDASFRKSVVRLLAAAGYQVQLYKLAIQFLETASLAARGCVLLEVLHCAQRSDARCENSPHGRGRCAKGWCLSSDCGGLQPSLLMLAQVEMVQ